jgi:hypothetical protein
MKKEAAILISALAICLLAAPLILCGAKNRGAIQNPLEAIAQAAKQKAAEDAMTTLLNNQLPLTLNANSVFPTVNDLPGAPFQPTALQLTTADLDKPLPPGDYTIPMMAFCSEYSVHRPGVGVAYVLGPLEGKAASAIGALYWRGLLQYNLTPEQLETVGWAIQSGFTYAEMPQSYQAVIAQVIPDFESDLSGDFLDNLESTYQASAKSANLPPLDQVLAKLGKPGELALSAEQQQVVLKEKDTNDQVKDQTLFQGQDNTVYTPVNAEIGPWTERIPGVAYMRLQIEGGNLQGNNVMQIRIMPNAGTSTAELNNDGRTGAHSGARFVRASYSPGQVAVGPAAQMLPTLTNLVEGIIGYSMGAGAQALAQVPALPKAPAAKSQTQHALAGKVTIIEGSVTVLRDGVTTQLAAGDSIEMSDVIQTAAQSRLQILFQDDTEMTMSENTKLTIDDYVFDPNNEVHDKASYSILEGAFLWISGKLGKPETDTNIETSYGTLGRRGTEFVAKYSALPGSLEIDLVDGGLDITPKQATTATSFTGPLTIMLSDSGAKTSPLTQAQYNADVSAVLPPLPAAGQ